MNACVVPLPALLDDSNRVDRGVVVFDVLRATTTIAAALAAGVTQIHICPTVDLARAEHALQPAAILCGEIKCLKPEGFDLGNSPGAFGPVHAGRPMIMSTTNGTRAILAARGARWLIAGAIVNARAVADAARQTGHDLTLLCAGTDGAFALEDLLGAGAVLHRLQAGGPLNLRGDVARLALRLWSSAEHDLPKTLADSTGGQNVIGAHLAPDLAFAARTDSLTAVGWLHNNLIRPVRPF